MGGIRKPPKVKLISGFIFKEEEIFHKTLAILEKHFGKIDYLSPEIPFVFTNYYKKEMGEGLKRRFISFKKFIPAENLPSIKVLTNKVEDKFAIAGSRQINIDPGFIDLAKLVLATTKDFQHRIYLNKGIYAEITLSFQGKSFKAWPWTYPDYQTKEYIDIFNQLRNTYARESR